MHSLNPSSRHYGNNANSERIFSGTLNPAESARLASAIGGFASGVEWPNDAAGQVVVGRAFRPVLEDAMPRIARILHDAKNGNTDAIHLSGLPTDPDHARVVLLAATDILGPPFNYSRQNRGAVVMELRPRPGSGPNTNSTDGEFEMHTDDAALPRCARTEFICLYGIVNPTGVLTSYVLACDAIDDLEPEVVEILRQERFLFRFPPSLGLESEKWSKPSSILAGFGSDLELRFPSYATRPSDPDDLAGIAAIAELKDALDRHAVGFALDPGCFLAFNNSRGAHKRSAIEGKKRLVLRTYGARRLDFLREVTGQPGPIFTIDSFAKSICG